jgi:Xaa-Pro aminopeptidase
MDGLRVTNRLVDHDWLSRLLTQSGLDAVVATSPEHIQLLTGYSTWLERETSAWMLRPEGDGASAAGYAVTRTDGVTGLVASPICAPDAAASGADVVRIYERRPDGLGAAFALRQLLDDLALSGAAVGVELSGADETVLSATPEAAPADSSLLLRVARMRKSDAALRLMRAAAEATEGGLVHVVTRWGELKDPQDLQSAYRTCLAAQNADFDHLVYGIPGGGVSSTLARSYPEGSTTFLDAGARVGGLFSDTGLTIQHGQPEVGRQRTFDDARRALEAGVSRLVAGARASSVLRAMQECLSDNSLRAQAHGLGLSIREWPFFSRPTDGVVGHAGFVVPLDPRLVTGTVVNLEVGGHCSDGSSVQIEQTWIVAEPEPLALTVQSRDRPWESG